MVYNINRPLRSDEKVGSTGIRELGETDIIGLFLKDLTKVKITYDRKFRPFDSHSARLDFENNLRSQIDMVRTKANKTDEDSLVDFGDLHRYGNSDRFIFVKKDNIIEDKLLDGMRQPYKIGIRYHFKGKARGNRLSIQVPLLIDDDGINHVENMEAWINKTFLKKEVDDKKPKVEVEVEGTDKSKAKGKK